MAANNSVAAGSERDRPGGPAAAGGTTWRRRARRAAETLMSAPGIVVRVARLLRRSREHGMDETSLSPQPRAIYRQLTAAIGDRFAR